MLSYSITGSLSARRWEDDGFDARPKPHHSYRRQNLYLRLLCQMGDINSMSRGNSMAPNRCNSVQCTVRTPNKGRAIKGLVVCNNWDLETLDLLNVLALGFYEPSPEVFIVYKLQLPLWIKLFFFDIKNITLITKSFCFNISRGKNL